MLGTIVNTSTIIAGSLLGSIFRQGIKENYKKALFDALGLATVGLGANAVVSNMPQSKFPVLFILSLALGSIIGTLLDIDGRFQRLAGRLKGGSDLGQGLSTAILLFCIGTLSILGPIESALYGNNTYLFTNATLDFVASMVLASAYGIGIALAGVVLFCWQGSIYLLAGWLTPFLTVELMTEISIIGGVFIMSSGFAILELKKFKTLNMLPALIVPAVWVLILKCFSNVFIASSFVFLLFKFKVKSK